MWFQFNPTSIKGFWFLHERFSTKTARVTIFLRLLSTFFFLSSNRFFLRKTWRTFVMPRFIIAHVIANVSSQLFFATRSFHVQQGATAEGRLFSTVVGHKLSVPIPTNSDPGKICSILYSQNKVDILFEETATSVYEWTMCHAWLEQESTH